jgi:hypothetical protein
MIELLKSYPNYRDSRLPTSMPRSFGSWCPFGKRA